MGIFSFKTKCYDIDPEVGFIPSTGNSFKDWLVRTAGVVLFAIILYGGIALFVYLLFLTSSRLE